MASGTRCTPPVEMPERAARLPEMDRSATATNVSYPTRTKIVIVVVLFVAIGGFVLAGLKTSTDPEVDAAISGAEPQAPQVTIANGVERLQPGRGTEAFAQESIEIDLVSGWRGELVIQPDSGDAIPLPEGEVEFTSLNQLIFEPGEGKTIERLPSGQVCVRATIWDQVRGRPATERVESWCFDVT